MVYTVYLGWKNLVYSDLRNKNENSYLNYNSYAFKV